MLPFSEPVSPVPAQVREGAAGGEKSCLQMQGARVGGGVGLFKHESEELGVDPRSPISNFLCKPLNTECPVPAGFYATALWNKGRYCMRPHA